jgi:hypothetical protein
MQGPPTPTEDDEASIPTEHVGNGPHASAGSRKAAKRTFPWDLQADEIKLVLPDPQGEAIPARKKQRLDYSLPTSTDEATTKNTSHDTSVALPSPALRRSSRLVIATSRIGTSAPPPTATVNASTLRRSSRPRRSRHQTHLPPIEGARKTASPAASPDRSVDLTPPAADNDDANKNAYPVTDKQSNARATGATGHWTPEEDAELKNSVASNRKKKCGKECKSDWVAIAALVPGRTKRQCCNRWYDALDPSVALTAGRKGKWTEDEDKKLKGAVETHGGSNWKTIVALVPGRTRTQCQKRWRDNLVHNIDPATAHTGKWTADEDKTLKNAVQTHGGKDWVATAALVPGRTKRQCCNRWHETLDPSIALTAGRKGKWTADEDKKLRVP